MRPTIAALALLSLASPTLAASITVYTSSAAFLAAAGPVTTETFDEFFHFGATAFPDTVTIGGVTYRTGAPYPRTGVIQGAPVGFVPSSSPNIFINQSVLVSEELQFGGQWVTSLGLFLLPVSLTSTVFTTAANVTVVEQSGVTTVIPLTFTSPTPSYIGFVSTVGIVQLIVTPTMGSQGTDAFAFDDVSHSPAMGGGFPVMSIGMPAAAEPASLVGFVVGLVGVAGVAGVGLMVRARKREAPRPPT